MVQIETHENEPRHRLSALRAGHPVTFFDIIAALISHFLTSDMADGHGGHTRYRFHVSLDCYVSSRNGAFHVRVRV